MPGTKAAYTVRLRQHHVPTIKITGYSRDGLPWVRATGVFITKISHPPWLIIPQIICPMGERRSMTQPPPFIHPKASPRSSQLTWQKYTPRSTRGGSLPRNVFTRGTAVADDTRLATTVRAGT